MALFPAYEDKKSVIENNETKLPWLQNESCPDIPETEKIISKDLHCSSKSDIEIGDEYQTSDSDDNEDEVSSILYEKKKKEKKKKKKSSKELDSDEYFKKRKKKSSHKKKKRSRNSSDSDSEQSKQNSQEYSTMDGKQKDVLFHGDFRSLKKEDVIYLDRFPDKNNSIFCTTHYAQLCSYHKPRLLPMGMLRNPKPKKKPARYFTTNVNDQLDPTPVMRLIKQNSRNSEYIPMNLTYEEERTLKEQRNRCLRNNSSGTKDDVMIKKVFDKDVHVIQDGLSEKDYWQNLNKSYNENLSKEPHNISLWMEFIDIQDKVMAHCFNENHQKKTTLEKNQKSVIERKISVLESAISKNSKALELYLKRLHLGESVWEKDKLVAEWNKLIYTFPNNINVWHNYLIFYQTYFALFHLDQVVKAYSKCTEKFIQMQQATFLSHEPPENLVFELVDITAELANIWYQSGFMERSIAIFQALIELNFFCPPKLDQEHIDLNSKIEIFEAFWDSKAPRFGENKSIGWSKFMEKREPVVFPEIILEGTKDEEDGILLKGGTKSHLWLEIEYSRESNHWSSWQEDPEYCEDLERLVTFNVIKRHLFFVNTDEEKFYLVLKFLNFFGVSIPSDVTEVNFTVEKYDSVFFPSRLETLDGVINVRKEYSNDDIGLFSFPVIGPSVFKPVSEIYFDFICGLIQKFILLFSSPFKIKLVVILIGFYTKRILALKRKSDVDIKPIIKNYKKNIKNLLKENEFRSDSKIYYAYAQFEACIGSKEEACKIHSMIMNLTLHSNSDIFNDERNSEDLWCHLVSYVRLHLERDSLNEKVINDLLNVIYEVTIVGKYNGSDHSLGATHILKLKNKFTWFIDLKLDCLRRGTLERSNILSYSISLFSMILLVIEGFEEVCLTFEKFISKLCTTSETSELLCSKTLKNVNESLYVDYLWTLNTVIKKDHFRCNYSLPPSLVRQILKSAINVAPNNLYFLENFAEKQNWKDMLCGSDIQPKSDGKTILFTLFRILPHIKKVVALISNAEFGNISSGHQLQNILESAISSESGRNCPLLWRIYLRLISVTKPKDLLSLFYRALHSCPFAKCLYLDCIKLLPDKLPDILAMMTEKGIRIRLPVEELEVLLEEEKEDEETEEQDVDEEETKESVELVTADVNIK